MLISEFAKRAGLSTDTVRFYIRKGLLEPDTGMKGGANPYQIFTEEHLESARLIRMGQSLGFSLREIATLAAEYKGGGMTPARSLELMRLQLVRLEEKAGQLGAMVDYTRAKVAWLEGGQRGPEPVFGAFEACSAQAPEDGAVGGEPRRAARAR
ncbi:MerR family transcriptional regulator [Sphingomonas sp. QA11]|uniref:helix-turn-helix domain-containing protein n=1 Tax=Sphingomonas sp. QA11 TaxID=2950605 RepID=UPI00234A12D2|nr:MerR family transcriptional regulator [Sphingomonas sp. QA11]WCM25180.1 MerR family transcriptional regulator [Sphingomonas sp. QA11]